MLGAACLLGLSEFRRFFARIFFRYVDIDSELSKERLEHLTRKPEKKELVAMAEARDLVLNKYNFFPHMQNILEKMQ